MKGFKGMKIKTIKSLLISATMVAIILTGCGSKDTESEIESEITTEVETATIEETTTESETTTTEEETSTIEETSTESETTTEVETSTTEETTSTTSSTITATTVNKNGLTFASDVSQKDMQLISDFKDIDMLDQNYCDSNGDGVIDKSEASEITKFYDESMLEQLKEELADDLAIIAKEQSKSTASSSTTPNSSSSSLEERADETDPNDFIDWSTPIDHTGYSTTGHTY
jgi:hypothetical protein